MPNARDRDFRRRLWSLIKQETAGNVSAFAKRIGESQPLVSRWLGDEGRAERTGRPSKATSGARLPSYRGLAKLAAFGYSVDWLLTGAGPERRDVSRPLATLQSDLEGLARTRACHPDAALSGSRLLRLIDTEIREANERWTEANDLIYALVKNQWRRGKLGPAAPSMEELLRDRPKRQMLWREGARRR